MDLTLSGSTLLMENFDIRTRCGFGFQFWQFSCLIVLFFNIIEFFLDLKKKTILIFLFSEEKWLKIILIYKKIYINNEEVPR
jgi:hypothetical protein